MPQPPVTVHYAELRGAGARAILHDFMGCLSARPGFLGAELLSSPAQPGLLLVASRWAGAVPGDLPLPAGAKAWTFTVEARASDQGGADQGGSDQGGQEGRQA